MYFRLGICKLLLNFYLKQWNCSQLFEVSKGMQIMSVNLIVQVNIKQPASGSIVHIAQMEVYFV